MGNLISFEGTGEVPNKLIDKISTAVGWIATRETPKKVAVDTYIKDIQNSSYDPLTKAALISQAKKSIKEYCNQNDILDIAKQNMSETAKPENVDDDWIAQFMDKAKLISDKEFQMIWGKILAEECTNPGSMPKSLLHTLERMDKNDALSFSAVCSVSVYVVNEGQKDFYPMIYDTFDDFYKDIGINPHTIANLQALGLIEESIGMGVPIHCDNTPIVINYYGTQKAFHPKLHSLHTGHVIFTKSGNALCRVIDVDPQEGFWEKCCGPLLNMYDCMIEWPYKD